MVSHSQLPFDRVVKVDDLGAFSETLKGTSGESLRVCRLADHPEWLFKQYSASLNSFDVEINIAT